MLNLFINSSKLQQELGKEIGLKMKTEISKELKILIDDVCTNAEETVAEVIDKGIEDIKEDALTEMRNIQANNPIPAEIHGVINEVARGLKLLESKFKWLAWGCILLACAFICRSIIEKVA